MKKLDKDVVDKLYEAHGKLLKVFKMKHDGETIRLFFKYPDDDELSVSLAKVDSFEIGKSLFNKCFLAADADFVEVKPSGGFKVTDIELYHKATFAAKALIPYVEGELLPFLPE
jgi:hypothetical protein